MCGGGRFCEKTIRWASAKYLKGVYPQEATEFDVRNYSSARLLERTKKPDALVLVAKKDGKVVGILTGSVCGESGVAILYWVAVDPDHQHEGIGMSLMVRSEEFARKRGCHRIHLHAQPALVPAIRLYMKFGLLPEAYLRKAWWGSDFILMSKWLGEYKKAKRR